MFLLHVLGDFRATQPLDLPLRRTGPHRVGTPNNPSQIDGCSNGAVLGTLAPDLRTLQRRVATENSLIPPSLVGNLFKYVWLAFRPLLK